MISGVTPARRALVGIVVAAVVAALAPARAQAQSADDGWFDDGSGAQPPAQGAASTPAAPAAPGAPSQPSQPGALAPSPLLDNRQAPQAPVASAEDQDPRALTAWNSYVDPYGAWVEDPRYGRVWVPNSSVVGSDFAPYSTGGHWSLDENDEWVWQSDYPFGWVTFHYGRWVWISGSGWAWIPGMEYAPAWVTWRVPVGSYGYVGWAPLPPAYVWFGGGPVWFGYAPLYPWVFCPSEYVFSYHVHSYIVRDHVAVGYAARYTRPYAVASPRAGGGYHVAAPHGPTPQAAHVPARAVPMERVSSRAIATRGSIAATGSVRGNFGGRTAAPVYGQRSTTLGRSPMMPASRTLGAERAQPAYRSGPAPQAYRPTPQTFRSSPQPYRSSPAPQYRPSTPQFAPNRGSVAPRPMSAPHTVRSAPSWGGSRSYGGGGGGSHFSGGGHSGSGHFGGGHGHR
jgi:hypothetical protein